MNDRVVSTEILELDENMKLVPVRTEGKNDLKRGQLLHLNGYSYDKYVIVENKGINEHFPNYGSRYRTVNLRDYTQQLEDAYVLKHISEKKDGRIQKYIIDETMPEEEIKTIWEKSEKLRLEKEEIKRQEETERNRQIERGKELYEKYIPDTAKALIVAKREVDDCDLMTDYFNTKTTDMVILGWSKHKRDLFSEMRKHADKIPETAHLKNRPNVDSNGEPKTETNREWWMPADEHREKYSMGKGYYLKDGITYSTGWLIQKNNIYNGEPDDRIYISLAKRCIFNKNGGDKIV